MLSSERILSELLKLFSIYDSSRIIPLMFEVLDCLFILDSGLLNACLRLNMFDEMSALERMCLLFRCSTVEKDKLIRQYKLPKYIANRVLLNVRNTDANAEKNQRKLKEVSNGYRTFYAKCLVTYMYFSGQLSEEAAKQLLEELMSFCNSEYADFNFKLSLLPEYDLNYEQKKTIMMTTKAFWLESAVKVSTQDCLHFAQQLINEHFLTRKI
jgi:tRNA nucleotidyltransferase/poly(A) polymerase